MTIQTKCIFVADDKSHHDTHEGALERNKYVAIAKLFADLDKNGYGITVSASARRVIDKFEDIKKILERTS